MATRTVAEGRSAGSHRSRLRRLSNWLIVLGVGVIIYAGVILAWGDPISDGLLKLLDLRKPSFLGSRPNRVVADTNLENTASAGY